MGREYERKYRCPAEAFAGIRAAYGPFREIRMETTYFDTPGLALRRRKWMLRIRRENGLAVCTLKTPLPDGSRGEWECEAADIRSGIQALLALGCPAELAGAKDLVPVCGARFLRLAAELPWGGSRLELALDSGAFLAGERSAPFSEAEIELKQGADADCDAFAEALAREFKLVPEKKSKAQRAFALLDAAD